MNSTLQMTYHVRTNWGNISGYPSCLKCNDLDQPHCKSTNSLREESWKDKEVKSPNEIKSERCGEERNGCREGRGRKKSERFL